MGKNGTFFTFLDLIIRLVERNSKVREVFIHRNSLVCDCSDYVFNGVPCRHMIFLANALKELKYDFLPFNHRWKIDYFEELEVIDEQILGSKSKKSEVSKGKHSSIKKVREDSFYIYFID